MKIYDPKIDKERTVTQSDVNLLHGQCTVMGGQIRDIKNIVNSDKDNFEKVSEIEEILKRKIPKEEKILK